MDIDFSDYQLLYNYPDKGPDNNVQWFATDKALIIPAGQSIVFWVKNGADNTYPTTGDQGVMMAVVMLFAATTAFVLVRKKERQ